MDSLRIQNRLVVTGTHAPAMLTKKITNMKSVYTVGDSTCWTVGLDYKKWANSKKFHKGDTLVFNYNNKIHNVMQMKQQDYNSCNTSSLIAVYTSGSDRITLKDPLLLHLWFSWPLPNWPKSQYKYYYSIDCESVSQ
ncbi:hypothetical protein Ddye_015814 [Dipteronia dyeriana]|uniref:Phytocyanin domain-containing protein n=1 Tax=Dipteronia dyeriana TaxID=168575 RepID=A0AAD9U6C8_9ROSI|nr:hypothetical protein Ddye_015814 [Dipteronia dyeriana]